jgi:hypothetical protein
VRTQLEVHGLKRRSDLNAKPKKELMVDVNVPQERSHYHAGPDEECARTLRRGPPEARPRTAPAGNAPLVDQSRATDDERRGGENGDAP